MYLKPRIFLFCLIFFCISACIIQPETIPTAEATDTPVPPTATAEPQPTTTPTPISTEVKVNSELSEETQTEIKHLLQNYFDLRYQSKVSLVVEDIGSFISIRDVAQEFLADEIEKMTLELRILEAKNYGYVEYSFWLDEINFTPGTLGEELNVTPLKVNDVGEILTTSDFDNHTTQNMVVKISLWEYNEFITQKAVDFSPEKPDVFSLGGLGHIIVMEREEGNWKIVSDYYKDDLWNTLRTTDLTPDEIFNATVIN